MSQLNTKSLPPPSPKPPQNQVTVVGHVYHQEPGRDPTGTEIRFCRVLDSAEQPWKRNTRIGDEWQPIDLGFVPDPGMIVIRNDGTQFRVNPTDEQRIEAAGKVLVLGVRTDDHGVVSFAEIPPGEALAVSPAEVVRWRVRCRVGSVAATILAYPK